MEDQLRILRSSQDPRKLGESQSSLRTKMLEENPEDIPEMIDDDMLDLGEISFGKMVGYSCFCSITTLTIPQISCSKCSRRVRVDSLVKDYGEFISFINERSLSLPRQSHLCAMPESSNRISKAS